MVNVDLNISSEGLRAVTSTAALGSKGCSMFCKERVDKCGDGPRLRKLIFDYYIFNPL